MCVWVCAPGCGYLQSLELTDPLELDVQVIVNYLVWMLGIKLESSGRAVQALTLKNHILYVLVYVCVLQVCLCITDPAEVMKGCWAPYKWSGGWL